MRARSPTRTRRAPKVVHRDIKPSNIIIEAGTGRAVVTDFGIATMLGDADSKLTRTGLFVGTVKYCAPEQMRHDPDLDGRVDVYSLGLVLYDLYTGQHLYAGLSDQEVVGRVLYGEDPDLGALASAEPGFARLVARAIHLDPDARYPTVDALLADLRACLQALEPEDPVNSSSSSPVRSPSAMRTFITRAAPTVGRSAVVSAPPGDLRRCKTQGPDVGVG